MIWVHNLCLLQASHSSVIKRAMVRLFVLVLNFVNFVEHFLLQIVRL